MKLHKKFKNQEEALQYIIASKKKWRRNSAKLAIEKKLMILEELREVSQWLKSKVKDEIRGT